MSALRMSRRIPAPVSDVYEAWTNGDLLARWFVCAPGWSVAASVDPRAGGAYRIEMREGERLVGVAWGTYLELEPPRRLVFSWSSEGAGAGVSGTRVTVELTPAGDETELVLVHELDPETPAGRSHRAGWTACLDGLVAFGEERSHAARA